MAKIREARIDYDSDGLETISIRPERQRGFGLKAMLAAVLAALALMVFAYSQGSFLPASGEQTAMNALQQTHEAIANTANGLMPRGR